MPLRSLLLLLSALLVSAGSAVAQSVDTNFSGKDTAEWSLDSRGLPQRTLTWPVDAARPGLRFTSQGMDLLTRRVALGNKPFEFSADLELTAGLLDPWPRFNGLLITLSSAPIDKMTDKDLAVYFGVLQHGPIATVARDKPLWGFEKRPGVWNQGSGDVMPRFVTTQGGGGGNFYSVVWPQAALAGTKLRFHAWRDSEHTVRFTIFHADGAAGPWWEAQATIPPELRKLELNHLTISTSRNADDFANFAKPVNASAAISGVVQRVRTRELPVGQQPAFNEPFPAAALSSKPAAGASMLLPREGGIVALREKFNQPMFKAYREVILKNASDEQLNKIETATPAQSNRLQAVLWAYLLTGDPAWKPKVLREIDAMCSVTDLLPAQQWGFPGRLRQQLNFREFMGHNAAALAEAYDLLGSELDQPRRDRILFVLTRCVQNYLERVKSNDWWYANNPSNTIGVGNGTMGLCALAIRHDNPELSKQAIDAAVRLITREYVGVLPDGSCNEGAMYWNYGLSYVVQLGDALRNVYGSDRGLLSTPSLRNAHQYLALNLGGDGKNVPFNDTQHWSMGWYLAALSGSEHRQPLMLWMADRMAQEYAQFSYPEQARANYTVLAFLLRDRTPAPSTFPGLPTMMVLHGVQEGILRSSGDLTPALATAVKGNGKINTHHANQDQGSFVLYADGKMILLDPGYFEDTADKHSLSLIGTGKPVLNPRGDAPISDMFERGDVRGMTVDATAAYSIVDSKNKQTGSLAKRVRRIFVQVSDQALITLDDIQPVNPQDTITAQWQAGVPVKVTQNQATLTHDKGQVTLQTFGPSLTLQTTPRQFSKDWVFKKAGVPWTTITGNYASDSKMPLITVLSRAAQGQNGPAVRVEYTSTGAKVFIGSRSVGFKGGEKWTVEQSSN